MNGNSNGMSTGMAIICTLGILLLIGWIGTISTPKCIKSGCDNNAKEGSSYCYLHDNYSYSYKSSGPSASGSYSSSTTAKSSTVSSGGKSTTTSGSKSTYSSSSTISGSKKTYSTGNSTAKKRNSSMDSYDEGYNAIYEDDDFDWDRYESDDDYAAGVDDAMEDEEDGDW